MKTVNVIIKTYISVQVDTGFDEDPDLSGLAMDRIESTGFYGKLTEIVRSLDSEEGVSYEDVECINTEVWDADFERELT
jgi:hypothetical protein